MDKPTDRASDRQTDLYMDGQGYEWTVEWTDRQKDIPTVILSTVTIVDTYPTFATFYRKCSYTALFSSILSTSNLHVLKF